MKIDVKLNLEELKQESIYCEAPGESIWVSNAIAENLIDLLGDITDDFDTVAKILFVSCTYPDKDEAGDHKKRNGREMVEALKKELIRKAIQKQFDF